MHHINDNKNHMLEIIQAISLMNVNVDGIRIMNRGEKSIYEVDCFVTGLDQLDKLLINLNKNKYIDKVERAFRWES